MLKKTLRSFRFVCDQKYLPLVQDLLRNQGFDFVQEAFSPFAWSLTREPFPLGASLAARFGYIYIQDRSSMLPPLALGVKEGATVLDLCASPGSKTGLLAQLVGKKGMVLGNEPNPSRLQTLRKNMSALNLSHCLCCSVPAEAFPMHGESKEALWDYILLDPPCSGWGTVEKNTRVMEIWHEDKIKPLITLQKRLLLRAYKLLRPGGRLVYSTCTTNIGENEEQVRYAVNEIGFTVLPLEQFPGFQYADIALQEAVGSLAISTSMDSQGFFLALLEKPAKSSLSLVTREDEGNLNVKEEKKGMKREKKPRVASLEKGEELSFELLKAVSPHINFSGLEGGKLYLFQDKLYYIPPQMLSLSEHLALDWKGFLLAKMRSQSAKLSAHLRFLLPDMAELQDSSFAINLEDVGAVVALLQGQSLSVQTKQESLGLYYRGLPLAWLTVKGGRALLGAL